ncbi:MAG: TetR family transcriptional regulator [Actinomycetota bacterium]
MSGIDTREKILQAADRLFAEVGYDAATTREIAEISGVNKALIHYHFKNKEDLLASILDRYYERLTATLAVSLQGDGSILDRAGRLVDAYMDFLSENRNFARTIQREASGGRNVDRIREHMIPIYRMGTELLHEAYPATLAGDLSAEQLLTSYYGMIVTYFTYGGVLESLVEKDPYSRGELEKRKRHIHRMLEIVDEALRKEGSDSKRGF